MRCETARSGKRWRTPSGRDPPSVTMTVRVTRRAWSLGGVLGTEPEGGRSRVLGLLGVSLEPSLTGK